MKSFLRMTAAVNAGDAHVYASLYAQDAVITIYGGNTLSGRDAIEQYEVDLLREFPGARLAFYDVWQTSERTVAHYGVNGKTSDGRAMGHEGLLFYRFDSSGLIAEEHRYLDALTPMAQLGALGPVTSRAPPQLPQGLRMNGTDAVASHDEEIAAARACFDALAAKDEARFVANLADDVVLDDLTEARPRTGKPDARAWFDTQTSAIADVRTEITSAMVVEHTVLLEMLVHGTLQAPLGMLQPSSEPFTVHRAAIADVKDGQIARLSLFMNGKELATAVGQWPPIAMR